MSTTSDDLDVAMTPCTDLSAADWLVDSRQPWPQLIEFGPAGLPAYARLRFLPDPAYQGQSENDVNVGPDAPADSDLLRIVLESLAPYTRTPDDCYFCLWDGWGLDVQTAAGVPKVVVPHRAYYLFRGKLTDFGDWGPTVLRPGMPPPHLYDPAFAWPADRAWCVTKDVDPHWAGIGADPSAIDRLVADPRLDVVRADPDEPPPRYF